MKFDMPTCGACRTCEIMCSYHHTERFAPSLSSIRIHENPSGEGCIVDLFEEDTNLRKACDGCAGRKEPLCMEVCTEKEFLRKVVDQYLCSAKAND